MRGPVRQSGVLTLAAKSPIKNNTRDKKVATGSIRTAAFNHDLKCSAKLAYLAFESADLESFITWLCSPSVPFDISRRQLLKDLSDRRPGQLYRLQQRTVNLTLRQSIRSAGVSNFVVCSPCSPSMSGVESLCRAQSNWTGAWRRAASWIASRYERPPGDQTRGAPRGSTRSNRLRRRCDREP